MSEQSIIEPQEPTVEPGAGELARLRTTNLELLATKRTLKARVTELEGQTAELAGKLTAAESKLRVMTVDGPLKTMAESISKAPAALIAAFQRSYKLEPGQDGRLTILHAADGKPVMVKDKAVPFEPDAVRDLLLTSTNEADAELYNSIIIVSKASGAMLAPAGNRSPTTADARENKGVAHTFGLK